MTLLVRHPANAGLSLGAPLFVTRSDDGLISEPMRTSCPGSYGSRTQRPGLRGLDSLVNLGNPPFLGNSWIPGNPSDFVKTAQLIVWLRQTISCAVYLSDYVASVAMSSHRLEILPCWQSLLSEIRFRNLVSRFHKIGIATQPKNHSGASSRPWYP